MFGRIVYWCLAAVGLLSACHDAPRNNPVDGDLTPAVEIVSARVDTAAGRALLEWQPYSGQQPFAAYRLERREQGVVKVDTVGEIADPNQTSYNDTTIEPELDYVYRVVVINSSGFEVPGPERLVASFGVEGVLLHAAEDDSVAGNIALRWQAYRGPRFEAYVVWRGSFGEEDLPLKVLTAPTDTTWRDEEAFPDIQYTYWVETRAAGLRLNSAAQEGTLSLPAVALLDVGFSSLSATAQLNWTQYRGPRFVHYEVRRQTGRLAEETVGLPIEDITQTSFVDSFLDGNTEYTYGIKVVTAWDGVDIDSNRRSGAFYQLEEDWILPSVANLQAWALALAFDQMDQLYVATTQKLTTSADQMESGIFIQEPDALSYRNYFNFRPHRLSPVFLHVEDQRIFVAVLTEDGELFVGAVEGARALWGETQPNIGENPIGIFVDAFEDEADQVAVVDSQGWIYRFDRSTGAREEPNDDIERAVKRNTRPLIQLVVGKGVGLAGKDQFFFIAPERSNNHLVGKTRTSRAIFGGETFVFDDGVGPNNGQTIGPLSMAFDAFHTRLVVVEFNGRLQLFDARSDEIETRYITQWGGFGDELGQFNIATPTAVAVAVDSRGRIHVADGSGVEGRVQVFAP